LNEIGINSDFPMTEADERDRKTPAISPPRWMTRVEKRDFNRVIEARNAVGNPLLSTERDLLLDYVGSRSRLTALRMMLKDALKDAKDYPPSQKHAAALIRQLDTSTSLSRRLARELKLVTNQQETKHDDS
jgi:hypothetical protein